jgi:hypothetical protein
MLPPSSPLPAFGVVGLLFPQPVDIKTTHRAQGDLDIGSPPLAATWQ